MVSMDGKGVVMPPEAFRPATARGKLSTRLAKASAVANGWPRSGPSTTPHPFHARQATTIFRPGHDLWTTIS